MNNWKRTRSDGDAEVFFPMLRKVKVVMMMMMMETFMQWIFLTTSTPNATKQIERWEEKMAASSFLPSLFPEESFRSFLHFGRRRERTRRSGERLPSIVLHSSSFDKPLLLSVAFFRSAFSTSSVRLTHWEMFWGGKATDWWLLEEWGRERWVAGRPNVDSVAN